MSPENEPDPTEDPDLVAERLIASLRFLCETAERFHLGYLEKPLLKCAAVCEVAYLRKQRKQFNQENKPKHRNGK